MIGTWPGRRASSRVALRFSMMNFRAVFLAIIASAAPFVAVLATKPPSNDRDWDTQFERTPDVTWRGQVAEINWVRDWSYDGHWSLVDQEWLPSVFIDPATIQSAWMVFEPHRYGEIAAHTFLIFTFENQRTLVLSVDARRRSPEYREANKGAFRGRAIRGVLNGYELIYSWSTGRDHLLRRALFTQRPLQAYRINRSAEELERSLRWLLTRTERFSDRPVFYNTFVKNCTTELNKAFGLSWHYSDIMTGYADTRYFEAGFMGQSDTFGEAVETAGINEALLQMPADTARAFDEALVAYLDGKMGMETSQSASASLVKFE